MALTLPYPDMNFVPLDVLTAAEQNQLVANIEYLANNVNTSNTIFNTVRTKIYVDNTNGDDSNDGLSTASPKKTLASVFAKINELGGSASIRFMSAGTYTVPAGYFDGANFVFEKNSSSLGDVILDHGADALQYENSVVIYSGMKLTGTGTSGVTYYNSYITYQGNTILEIPIYTYGSSIFFSGNDCTISNRVNIRDGSSLSITGATIKPVSTISTGSIIILQRSSELTLVNAPIIFEPMPTDGGLIFISLAENCKMSIHSGITITDNMGNNKLSRGMSLSRSMIIASAATLETLNNLGRQDNYFSMSLRVYSNAILGA